MAKEPAPDPLFTLRGEMEPIHCLLFHLNGDTESLYASTQAGIVHKWNLQNCREESQIIISTDACLAIKFIQDYFISQEKGGEIKLWKEEKDGGTWKLTRTINLDYWGFCRFGISSCKLLVCSESGSKIKLVNLCGETVRTLSPSTSEKCGEVMAIKCFELNNQSFIFALYESGLLYLYNMEGSVLSDLKVTSDCPMALDFDGNSKGMIGTSGDIIYGFELTDDLKLVSWKRVTITNPGVSCLVIRPDKKLFAAGCWDYRIRLFSMKSLKLLVVLVNHKDTIQDICYSPARVQSWDTQWLLAAAGKDGRITLWNIY